MKTIKHFLVAIFATIALTSTSCSNDNSNNNSSDATSPDTIGETEWVFNKEGEFTLYFSKTTTQCHISQVGGNLLGTYNYAKPTATITFPKAVGNTSTGLYKTDTKYIANVKGNQLTISVNGQNMIFTKVVD